MRIALIPFFPLLAAALAVGPPPHHEVSCTTTPCTTIVIENSRSTEGNTTIDVPIGPIYRNKRALAAVSALYILRKSSISCIPYFGPFATGPHGMPFAYGHPSVMPDEDVQVGSIMCTDAGLISEST
ncbi:hypothetical protein F5Y14DRAFT_447832 [Nemania sp. NC0429]|nr:hypothetical protein F5Y14DRAFT_447832 [Nemania sp. NC0429]